MSSASSNTVPTQDDPLFLQNGKEYLRLYYYMPAEPLFDLLSNDEIKVSIPEECNDPLEFMSAAVETRDGTRKEPRLEGGFISFSGRYDNSLMWSHYADSHKGVCLRFDFPIGRHGYLNANEEVSVPSPDSPPYAIVKKAKFPEQFTEIHPFHNTFAPVLVKVQYQPKRPTLSSHGLGGSFCCGNTLLRLDLSPVFFTKAPEWEYEKEWRLIVTPALAKGYHDNAFFVKGLTKYITYIFIGKRFPQTEGTTWAKVLQALKNNKSFHGVTNIHHKLDLARAEYHPQEYKIIVPRLERQEMLQNSVTPKKVD